ncbi:MAG: VOC family protein [Rhodospirillales bacterium]|nr:VOC family protein [Rhodospirillales bacterium]
MKRPLIRQQVTFLYTDDLAATSAFYRDVMELEFALDQGPCHIYKLSPTSFIGLCTLADRPTSPVGVTISLVVDDVDGFHATLVNKGVTCERSPAFSERFNVYSCLFIDPNGYRLEIQEFRDPEWKN